MAKNDKGFSAELLDQLLAGRDPQSVLDNEGFRARAPKDVIEKDEARAGEITQRMQRLKDTLARLG